MEYITYEMFGAVGDGVTDDLPAIVKAHAEANAKSLPVKAKEGATYYLRGHGCIAVIQTSTDWTGARFIIDDSGIIEGQDFEARRKPVFQVTSRRAEIPLSIDSLRQGQTTLANPTGEDLYVLVRNANHRDYIRWGLNQNNGTARTDNFILRADGTLPSPVAFDFDEVTDATALPIDAELLTITGGTFTTIANQAKSEYNYYVRNLQIQRSHVEVSGLTHLVTGEIDHGAPYSGFLTVSCCAQVYVHDCVFTGHYIYNTIGAAGKPVDMGSYDINLSNASSVTLARCSQTTDIMDRHYWGLIGTNFCRDLVLEDCNFSRFDAHMGVTNCTLRRCVLGWQCLNAIGYGTFLVEDTEAYGHALVNLRVDYGSSWNGEMIIRNCTWHPLGQNRSIFEARNPGNHDFGYTCYLPQYVTIDRLQIVENAPSDRPLTVFNDYSGDKSIPEAERIYKPIPPVSVTVRHLDRDVQLCALPSLMPDTTFIVE